MSHLIERALHAETRVGCYILEGPAERAQTVVWSVARTVHQVAAGLLSYRQVKTAHKVIITVHNGDNMY